MAQNRKEAFFGDFARGGTAPAFYVPRRCVFYFPLYAVRKREDRFEKGRPNVLPCRTAAREEVTR